MLKHVRDVEETRGCANVMVCGDYGAASAKHAHVISTLETHSVQLSRMTMAYPSPRIQPSCLHFGRGNRKEVFGADVKVGEGPWVLLAIA